MNMQAVKARKITEPVLVLRTAANHPSITNDLAAVWSNFGETKNMLQKVEDKTNTVSSPPRLVHLHKQSIKGKTVQFSHPVKHSPNKKEKLQVNDVSPGSSTHSSSVMIDGDYLNNEICVLNADTQEGNTGTANIKKESSPLDMEPLRSGSSSREDEPRTAVPYQPTTTMHSNKGAIFGPPINFDKVTSTTSDQSPVVTSAPTVPSVTVQPVSHHVPLRKFQIPESALASLKKTIEKQKIDVQASGIKLESVTSKMEPLIADSTEESSVVSHNKPVRRKLHQTYDLIVATNVVPSGNCNKKRKVAVAPSPLNYVQAQPVKNSSKQSHSTAASKERPSIKIQQHKSKPTVRKIAKPSEQSYQRKRPNQTAAITPSSWRAGREVIHKVLGPPKKPTRPPKQPQDCDLTAGDSSSSVTSSTDSVGLAVRSKQLKSSPSKESKQMLLLNANAAAVLSELGLSEEDGHPPPRSSVKPKRLPSLGAQQSAPRIFNPEPLLISRIRHYDADKVREYMEKKREARKKRDTEQRYVMQRAEMEKRKKLELLDEDRRQALQNNLRRAEMKRQQELFQEINQQSGIHIHMEEANPDSDKENRLQSSPPAKKHRSVLSTHILTSSSLLETLAMSDNKKMMPQQHSPLSQTLSESVSNQRPITGIPTAQSLRTSPPIGKMQEPDLHLSMDSVSKKVISSDFPSQGNLPDPVVVTKSKVPQKPTTVRSPDAVITSHKTVKASKRPHVAKSPSATFNTRDLPGVHNVDAHVFKAAQKHRQEEAVKRIQVAYRGHQVRKSLQWNLHSAGSHQKAKLTKHTAPHLTTAATTTTSSKQKSSVKSKKSAKKTILPQQGKPASVKKVTAPVTDKVTHKTMLEADSSEYNSGPTVVPPWEQTGGDSMSVINIYTRRYEKLQEQINATAALHAERCKEAFSSSSLTSGSQPSVTGKATSLLGQVQEERTHMEYTPLYSDSFEVVSDDHEVASATTAAGVADSQTRSQPVDTVNVVTASTLSERSFDPDSLQEPAEQSGTASTNSLSCISLINEGDEATTDVDQYSQPASVAQGSPHKSDSHDGGKETKMHLQTDTQPPLKYSPDSLGLKLNAELALLESVGDSLQQLSNVEGARAISTAQQETTGLANILKTRQEAHELEMKTMAQKAHDEVLQAKQQLQQMQQSAAEKFELLTKQTLYHSMEQQKKINQIQREAEEAQRMLSVHTGTLHHTATQTATPHASVKTDTMTSSVASGISTSNVSSQNRESSDNQTSLTTSSIPTYISDFEDNTIPTATNVTLGVSMATTVGSGDPHTVKSDTKKDAVATATDHVSEDISSEGDTLIEQHNSQLDSTLQNVVDSVIVDSDENDGDGVSFRMVLPSESHRKQSRDRLRSASESISSLATSHGDLSGLEPHGSSDGEESFCDFVSRMVRQYMLEEETRAQHQQALLKLREKALQEKNKLEMQWLNIKQQKMCNKGEDDKMPPLKKKQHEIMRKFQNEKAEIQRLQEASKQASQERKMLLKQQEDINKIRKSSQAYKDKLRHLMRGHQDVSLSSVSSVPAPTSDSSDSSPAIDTGKKNVSEPLVEVPSTSTPTLLSTHKSAKQLSLTDYSIREDISEQHQQHHNSSSHPIKTATSFPTYSPLDTQEVMSISGMSTDRDDEGKYSSVQEDHTSTDKDIATSTDSIPKQLKKLKISEKYLTQREKRVLKHKAAAEAALKKQQELMLREQEITKQEEEVNRIINQAMECFYQRKEAQKSRLMAPALDSLDVSSVVPVKTEQDKQNTQDSTSSVPEDLSDMVDHLSMKTSTVTQAPQVVSELYGNESFETLEVTSQLHTIPTAIISSTPRSNVDDQKAATISDVSDSLKMSDTLTETATTATSEASTDIESRIKVLKEQLKRRREEVKKSQQEQKRKKKALLKQKEEELKRKLQAVEVRATAVKEIQVVGSSEGSADISESDMEERSKQEQVELQSVSKVDSEIHGYTPFSEVTPTRTEQATTLEVSTALVADTSQDPTTAVVATTVDESQLSAPPDEVRSDLTAKSSPASSLTSSTVSVDHNSVLYTEEDIAGGESVITQLDDTLTKPLLPEHESDQSSYSDQHQLDDQHKEDRLPPKDQHDDQKSVDQLPLDQVDEIFTKTVTTQYDETFESHDDTSIKTDDIDHTKGHDDGPDHSTTTVEQREVVSELDDSTVQAQQTSSLGTTQAHSIITQQETSVKTRSVSSQLQSPIEAKLPLKASEVELSDSQPATEVSEASSIVDNEVLYIEHDISSFQIGGRVLIGQKMSGTIQFVGKTMFAPGTWIGVELDLPKGTNDGSLDGVRYFTCESSCGLFAPPSKVEIQSVATADATAVITTPPAEPNVRPSPVISPVNTSVSSNKTASDDITNEAIQPSVNEMDRVEDITAGLVKRLSDEAVDEMTAIWNKPTTTTTTTTTVAVQKTPDMVFSQDAVVSKVTDELFALLLRSEVEMMCKINDKKEAKVKTPTKLKLIPKPSVDHSPVVTPPSPFHLETKIPTAEELSQLRSLAVDPTHIDSPPRQQQTARVMAGDISPPHSPPLSPIATNANVRPLNESRSSSVESITQLLESHPVDTSRFLIPNDRETVNSIVASAWNACHQLSTEELHSKDIPAPSEVIQLLQVTSNLSEEEKPCVLAYQELVFELGVEVIRELRPCQYKPRPVWMPPQPVTLSRDPVNLERIQSIVFTRLMKGQLPFSLPTARYIHGGRRVCGREIDFVEVLLIKELRAEEKEWTNYDEDEELVKIQIADAMLESLLTDTINVMNDMVSRKSVKSITSKI